jgi:hypothetical protein
MSGPRADWERVGNHYYRKVQLYVDIFDDDLDLENYVAVGAPLGGAIGIDNNYPSWARSHK